MTKILSTNTALVALVSLLGVHLEEMGPVKASPCGQSVRKMKASTVRNARQHPASMEKELTLRRSRMTVSSAVRSGSDVKHKRHARA